MCNVQCNSLQGTWKVANLSECPLDTLFGEMVKLSGIAPMLRWPHLNKFANGKCVVCMIP